MHIYGDLINHHPHLPVMATDGAFTPDGVFCPLPTMSLVPLEDPFRHRVCKMLMNKGLPSAERVKLMALWDAPSRRERHRSLQAGVRLSSTSPARTEIFPATGQRGALSSRSPVFPDNALTNLVLPGELPPSRARAPSCGLLAGRRAVEA